VNIAPRTRPNDNVRIKVDCHALRIVVVLSNKFAPKNPPTVDGRARKQERDEQPIMLKQVKSICQSCLGGISDLSIYRQPCIRKTRAALASSHDLSAGDRFLPTSRVMKPLIGDTPALASLFGAPWLRSNTGADWLVRCSRCHAVEMTVATTAQYWPSARPNPEENSDNGEAAKSRISAPAGVYRLHR
jgi:hypothetical protein